MIPTNLHFAMAWASTGVPVVPLNENEKTPHQGLPKMPRGEGGYKLATTDPDQIRDWWTKWPNANLGADVARAGWVVLDVEGESHGFDANQVVANLKAEFPGDWITTRTHRTGGGGYHLIFRAPSGASPRSMPQLRSLKGQAIAGAEVKATGYVVLPPSKKADGGGWNVIHDGETLTAPKWTLPPEDSVQSPPAAAVVPFSYEKRDSRGDRVLVAFIEGYQRRAEQGNRNSLLNAYAFRLGHWVGGGYLPEMEASAAMQSAGVSVGLTERECQAVVPRAIKEGAAFPVADEEMAEELEKAPGSITAAPDKRRRTTRPGRYSRGRTTRQSYRRSTKTSTKRRGT